MDGPSDRFLNIYFIAQDIHERVSSSHYRYQDLAAGSSVQTCCSALNIFLRHKRKLAGILTKPFNSATNTLTPLESILALAELQNSLAYLEEQQQGHWKRLLMQLTYLFNNLATVEKQLNNINNPDAERLEEDTLCRYQPTYVESNVAAHFG